MCRNKIISFVKSGIILYAIGISNAFAEYEPNDNYSSLVLSYQSTTFANPVCIGTIDIECHAGLSGPSVVFARQIIPNLALGLAGSYLQSNGNTSSIKSTNGSAFVQGVVGLGRRVDAGASVAVLSSQIELCSSSPDSCASTSDTGTDLGVFGKVFLNDMKSLSVALSYNSISFRKSESQSVVALSLVTILARRHRLAFSVDRVRDSNGNAVSGGYGFGYSYLVY